MYIEYSDCGEKNDVFNFGKFLRQVLQKRTIFKI